MVELLLLLRTEHMVASYLLYLPGFVLAFSGRESDTYARSWPARLLRRRNRLLAFSRWECDTNATHRATKGRFQALLFPFAAGRRYACYGVQRRALSAWHFRGAVRLIVRAGQQTRQGIGDLRRARGPHSLDSTPAAGTPKAGTGKELAADSLGGILIQRLVSGGDFCRRPAWRCRRFARQNQPSLGLAI